MTQFLFALFLLRIGLELGRGITEGQHKRQGL